MVKEVCKHMKVEDGFIICGYQGRVDGSKINPLQLSIVSARRCCAAETPAKQVKCLLNLVQFDPNA